MRYDPGRLYRLETNTGYVWRAAAVEAPSAAARSFGLPPAQAVAELEKPSPTSRLFRLDTASGRFVLRAADAAHALTLDQQAAVANAVAYERIVKPLRARDGSYAQVLDGQAWIAYPEQPGELFTGDNCPLDTVVAEALALVVALRRLEPRAETSALPTVRHAPDAWARLVERLPDEAPSLEEETRELLAANASELVELAERLGTLRLRPSLVHDDLNHANVLVSDGAPFFLDLEDIRLESPEIAAAHAVFKLVRHAAYTGARAPGELRAEAVPRAVELLRESGVGIADRDELFAFAAYRNLSEIHEIVTTGSGLYDLEKKIANLFELYDLVPTGHGPPARR
jgi:hypothetical protein